jgi:hypothetical protein
MRWCKHYWCYMTWHIQKNSGITILLNNLIWTPHPNPPVPLKPRIYVTLICNTHTYIHYTCGMVQVSTKFYWMSCIIDHVCEWYTNHISCHAFHHTHRVLHYGLLCYRLLLYHTATRVGWWHTLPSLFIFVAWRNINRNVITCLLPHATSCSMSKPSYAIYMLLFMWWRISTRKIMTLIYKWKCIHALRH